MVINPDKDFPLRRVIDENGILVGDRSGVTDDELKHFYRWLVLLRTLDQRAWNLQRQGRMGTYPPFSGQEATQIGSVACLGAGDWLAGSYRDWAALTYHGVPLSYPLLNSMGHAVSGKMPEDLRVLPVQVVIAAQMLHAVGLAWASKLQHEDRIAMTFFGDGATSQGDFHEALNFASVVKAPVIFVCENNQWAISVPITRQMNTKTVAQRALSYDMEGVRVDGNDVVAVYQTVRELAKKVRAGEGPVLVEAVTYRLQAHTTADDPTRYRDQETQEAWAKGEPVARLRTYLVREGILSPEDVEDIAEQARGQVEAAVGEAESYPKDDPRTLFDHVYGDLTPRLKEQRARFAERLDETGEGD